MTTPNTPSPAKSRPMTLRDTQAVSELMRATEGCLKIVRLINDGDERPVEGHARSFCADASVSAFAAEGQDVRDAYLRVTTLGGMEVFWKVGDLIEPLLTGYMRVKDAGE
jgi:hypothetical protein